VEEKEIIGYIRSEVKLYEEPNPKSNVLDVLASNLAVRVISQQDGWLLVRPYGSFSGYVPKEFVLINNDNNHDACYCLSDISIKESNINIPLLPDYITPRELTQWLSTGGKPSWMPENYWQTLSPNQQQGVIQSIKKDIIHNIDLWNKWISEIQQQSRLDEARLVEWFTILQGEGNYFALQNEKLYKDPQENEKFFIGWINQNNIIRWTGKVKKDAVIPSKRWYEIYASRHGVEVRGWIVNFNKFERFIIPNQDNDPAFEENANKVFNLNEPILTFPEDNEVKEAIESGLNAAQYIDLKSVLGYSMRHYNLCGIFAVAAIVNSDVIPLIKRWIDNYPRANKIIKNPNEGTSIRDLQSLLDLYKFSYENANFDKEENNLSLLSARRLREKLHGGYVLIAGVSIKNNGALSGEGKIRHWVVVEDAIPVGISGWVRIYNSFKNADEVTSYRNFIDAIKGFGSNTGLGLWVKHPRVPILSEKLK